MRGLDRPWPAQELRFGQKGDQHLDVARHRVACVASNPGFLQPFLHRQKRLHRPFGRGVARDQPTQIPFPAVLALAEAGGMHQKARAAQVGKHDAKVRHWDTPFLDECTMAEVNRALRLSRLERAQVTEKFRMFRQLLTQTKNLTNR